MNTRKQTLIAIGLVAAAGGTIALYTALASDGGGGSMAAGHNHGAAATTGAQGGGPVHLSAERARRIGVTYAEARVQTLGATIRSVGNVTYDETRLAIVNPKIEGWVERLYVDFTGALVTRGQPLMEVYSPMLVAAQEELVLARRLVDQTAAGGSEQASGGARELLESSRRRLRYLDISPGVIAEVERTGRPRRTLTIAAPASGVVVEKNVIAGTRVMPGMDLYKIADISRVWIEGEIFEKDLGAVRPGQQATVTFETYPGETFDARVAYLYPNVSVEARTGRVRLVLANPGGRIMPGMYASVELQPAAPREALVVPRGAVHQTGERAMVFVRAADGSLVPRDVRVGLAAGDVVEIVEGLSAGETVVASANFLVDSESNMGAAAGSMPGMDMGTPGSTPPAGTPGAARATPGAPRGAADAPADPHAGMKM